MQTTSFVKVNGIWICIKIQSLALKKIVIKVVIRNVQCVYYTKPSGALVIDMESHLKRITSQKKFRVFLKN